MGEKVNKSKENLESYLFVIYDISKEIGKSIDECENSSGWMYISLKEAYSGPVCIGLLDNIRVGD